MSAEILVASLPHQRAAVTVPAIYLTRLSRISAYEGGDLPSSVKAR
jgi:hypothetical protein